MRFFLLFPALIAPLLLYAQAREDLRISPEEPYINTLPAEYRIQDADRIGNRTLVAWGTTVSAQHGYVLGSLRYQLLKGNQLLGPQRTLTPPNADPYAAVQVVPLASSFLLLWSDRRADSSGLYAQSVDIDGIPVGNERRIGAEILPHSLFGTEVVILGTPEEGRLLLWQQKSGARTATYGLHVAPDGTISDSARQVGSALERVVRFGNVPDVTLLHTTEGTLVVDRGGRIDERKVRDSLLSGPYYLEEDGSLLAVREKSLRKYRSLFVDAPEWSVPVPHLDSAAANTVMIGRDGGGRAFLIFTTIFVSRGTFADTSLFAHTTYRVSLSSTVEPPEFSPPDSLFSLAVYRYDRTGTGNGSQFQLLNTAFRQGCDNSKLITFTAEETPFLHGNGQPPTLHRRSISLNPDGVAFADSSGYLALCTKIPIISRKDTADASTVVVRSDGATQELSASITPFRSPIAQKTPQLINSSSPHLCTWIDKADGPVLARIPHPFFNTAELFDTLIIPSLPLPAPGRQYGSSTVLSCEESNAEEHMLPHSNAGAVISNRVNVCYLRSRPSTSTWTDFPTFYSSVRLYLPGPDGWRQVLETGTQPNLIDPYHLKQWRHGELLGYNAMAGTVIAGLFIKEPESSATIPDSLLVFNADGEITCRAPYKTGFVVRTWLPLDSVSWIAIGDNQGIVQRNGITLRTFSLAGSGTDVRYQLLPDNGFVRTGRSGVSPDTAFIEQYDSEGKPFRQERFPVPPNRPVAEVILQRPADSSIVLLWGTEVDGVHAALFDKRLSVIIADTLLSATRGKALNPSGAFSGDSLFLLWEDYRNGDADIYGTALPLPSTSGTAHDGTLAPLKAQLHPNLARSFVRIEFSRPLASTAELVLFDMQGTSVWHGTIPPGERSATISPAEIPSGAYRLRWSARNGNGFLPLVILR